jgi:excisionase family DNA binding protein
MTQRKHDDGHNLLTIGQARKLLGVSDVTLRHWTDEGKIKAFVTPGGHRRYSEPEVRGFIASQQRVFTRQNLIDEMDSEPRHKIKMARARMAEAPWYSSLDDEARVRLRELGGTVYSLIVEYLKTKRAARRPCVRRVKWDGSSASIWPMSESHSPMRLRLS